MDNQAIEMEIVENNLLITRPHIWPWPTIIMILVGAALAIYAIIDGNISKTRRMFGFLMILLWAALWGIILQVLWNSGDQWMAWGMLIFSGTIIVLFFVLILVLNIGL
jgi:hypothetical protein